MTEKLDGFCVQREGVLLAVKEELDCAAVQLQADALEQSGVMPQDLIVLNVKAHANNLIDVVLAEQRKNGGFALDVLHARRDGVVAEALSWFCLLVCLAQASGAQCHLNEHADALQDLDGHITPSIRALLQYLREMRQEVVLEEKVKESLVVLITPYCNLGNAAQSFDHLLSIRIGYNIFFDQHVAKEAEILDRKAVNGLRFRLSEEIAEPGPSGHVQRGLAVIFTGSASSYTLRRGGTLTLVANS